MRRGAPKRSEPANQKKTEELSRKMLVKTTKLSQETNESKTKPHLSQNPKCGGKMFEQKYALKSPLYPLHKVTTTTIFYTYHDRKKTKHQLKYMYVQPSVVSTSYHNDKATLNENSENTHTHTVMYSPNWSKEMIDLVRSYLCV